MSRWRFQIFEEYKASGGGGNELMWRLAQSVAAHILHEQQALLWRDEEAINQLLRIIEVNPKWNDGEARKQLIEIFNILGNENILVTEGRKKLSSMLFS